MPGREKSNAIAVEGERRVETNLRRVHVADAPFHKRNRRGGGKDLAMRANVVGMRMRNAAGFAVLARIQRKNGIAQADGFVVDEQI